jgi:alkylated DNA repair dioxygenase AlkB
MCGWHSDSHPQLGRNPPVASVSLGAVRVFELRKKKVKIPAGFRTAASV